MYNFDLLLRMHLSNQGICSIFIFFALECTYLASNVEYALIVYQALFNICCKTRRIPPIAQYSWFIATFELLQELAVLLEDSMKPS